MELLNLREVPLEGCDGIGHFEVSDRQLVASTLIAGERGLRACGRRLREQFRVDERVGDAVGRQRILEVTGIAHECPAGSERLSKESDLSRKPAVLFNPFRLFHDRRQVGRAFPQDLPVSGVRPVPSSSRGNGSVEPRQICTSARHWSESRRRSHQGCSTSGSRRTPGLTSS